jgi:putative inorganic carbon (hco3(-)) transporter
MRLPPPPPRGSNGRSVAQGAAPAAPLRLYQLRPGDVWRYLKRQPMSYLMVLVYFFFEYVRPQQIYEGIALLPWSKIVIVLAIVTLLLEHVSIRFEGPEMALALFSVIALASCAAAIRPDVAFEKVWDYVSWVIIIVLITNTIITEERLLACMLLFLAWNFKMAQSGVRSWASDGFAFRNWGIAGAPGWFTNSGEFAIQMCIAFALTMAFLVGLKPHLARWKQFAGLGAAMAAVVCVIGSSSRGSQVAAAVMALVAVAQSPYKFRALVSVSVLAVVLWKVLPAEQIERFQTMGDDQTSVARKVYWARGGEMMDQFPVLGIGFGNWASYHEATYGLKALPHNIFIEVGSQMGYLGLFGIFVLIVVNVVTNYRTRKLMRPLKDRGRFLYYISHGLDASLIAFLIAGQFVTVMFYPYFWINFGLSVATHRAARNLVARLARPLGVGSPPLRGSAGSRGSPRLKQLPR